MLIQIFEDYFLPIVKAPKLPAPTGDIFMKWNPDEEMSDNDPKVYRFGVGKLLQLLKWSRPECLNRVRYLTRFMV